MPDYPARWRAIAAGAEQVTDDDKNAVYWMAVYCLTEALGVGYLDLTVDQIGWAVGKLIKGFIEEAV